MVIFLQQAAIFKSYFLTTPILEKWQIKLNEVKITVKKLYENIFMKDEKLRRKNVSWVEAILCWSPLGVLQPQLPVPTLLLDTTNYLLTNKNKQTNKQTITSANTAARYYLLTNKQANEKSGISIYLPITMLSIS